MTHRNDDRPSRAEGILDRALDDDIVVLSSDGKVLHTLSDTAGFIWSRIDGIRTFDDIVRAMTDEYQVDEETARADAGSFLAELEKLGLIGGSDRK